MKKKYKRIIKGILFVCLSFFICLDVKAVEEAQKLLADETKELNDFRSQIYTPCKEVLDCRLVAKRISTLFK